MDIDILGSISSHYCKYVVWSPTGYEGSKYQAIKSRIFPLCHLQNLAFNTYMKILIVSLWLPYSF